MIRQWKDVKQEMINSGYNVTVKGRNKKELICEKDLAIVDLIYSASAFVEIWIFDTITDEMVYINKVRMIYDKELSIINSEVDLINGKED